MTTGSVLAQFTITLSKAVSEQVAVEWHTADGTALAGVDYAAAKGTVLFAPGQTAKTVDILVHGRAVGSEDRSFFVEMLPPTNAILGASVGECIIHVDTTGSTPVTQIIVPTGPRGLQGDSAYQVWLDLGNTGTEQDFIDSLKPSAEEIAQEVAPILNVGNSPVTAEGTETLSKPDSITVKRLARRIAYVGAAKIATVVLADGNNLIPHSSLSGDAVDFNSISLYPRILRGSVVISPEWSVEPGDKILIKSAVAGDVLYVCQYDVISERAVKNVVGPLVSAAVAPAGSQAFEALRRSYAEAGYNVVGTFRVGFTYVNANDVGIDEATGKGFTGPAGFVAAGTDPNSGGFTDRSMEYLRSKSASGVSLSRLMHMSEPLETALDLHRELGVELIIDCDCEYSYMLIKPGDSIRCVGWPTLTKKDNGVPSITATQAPERPAGYLDSFAVNAFFVVYHEANKSAERVRLSGGVKFAAASTITLDKYAHVPRLSFSHITNIRMDSQYLSDTLDGVHFKDEYANTIGDIHLLNAGMARYGFLWEDLYSGTYYSTGTSGNIYGLHTVRFRKPFRQKRHNYSVLSVCGGEVVGIDNELGAVLPLVFDIEDSVAVLDAPSTENLYGSFLKVKRTSSQNPASCVVNAPQANTGIFGSKDNTACKLFDVDGGASIVINGGFLTSAAAGYNLKFGGAKNDSLMQCNATDLTFVLNSIKNDAEDYTGFHEFRCMSSKYMMKLWGTTGNITSSGQIPFDNVEYDPFGLKTGNSQATVRRTGFYSVKGSVRTNDAIGYLSIYINGSERARTYFDHITAQTGEQWSTYVDFDGRINAGAIVELRITLTAGLLRGQSWYDNKFTVEMK